MASLCGAPLAAQKQDRANQQSLPINEAVVFFSRVYREDSTQKKTKISRRLEPFLISVGGTSLTRPNSLDKETADGGACSYCFSLGRRETPSKQKLSLKTLCLPASTACVFATISSRRVRQWEMERDWEGKCPLIAAVAKELWRGNKQETACGALWNDYAGGFPSELGSSLSLDEVRPMKQTGRVGASGRPGCELCVKRLIVRLVFKYARKEKKENNTLCLVSYLRLIFAPFLFLCLSLDVFKEIFKQIFFCQHLELL